MVVSEIISATVSVTLKCLVWEGTAGPCVPNDPRTVWWGCICHPLPPNPKPRLCATHPHLCPPSWGGSAGLRHRMWALQQASWDPSPRASLTVMTLGNSCPLSEPKHSQLHRGGRPTS